MTSVEAFHALTAGKKVFCTTNEWKYHNVGRYIYLSPGSNTVIGENYHYCYCNIYYFLDKAPPQGWEIYEDLFETFIKYLWSEAL